MRSTVIGCRNHLLFFIGKGAKAIGCNHIPALRDKLLQSVFCAIPNCLRSYGFVSTYATPVTYGCLFFITYLTRFNSLRATLIITFWPLLFIRCS